MSSPKSQPEPDYGQLDPATVSMQALTAAMDMVDDLPMPVTDLKLTMPLEMDVWVDSSGEVTLGVTPPHMQYETSFQSPLNSIKLHITPTEESEAASE